MARLRLILKCPCCSSEFSSQALHTDWGSGGGVRCPNCDAALRYSPPYSSIVLLASLPLLCFVLANGSAQKGLLWSTEMVIVWIIGSTILSVLISWVTPPRLVATNNRND